ncbi:MAG: GMC family oxidoreductase [Acidobacteriota bacterium]
MKWTRREILAATAGTLVAACSGTRTRPGTPALVATRGEDFDVCVIGSGFAGATVASGLAAAGVRTLLLDAGPRSTDASGNLDGATERLPLANRGEIEYPITTSRSLLVGGTSHKWTGVVSRLLPADFRQRTLFGHGHDWPIRYQTLYPYYCRAETQLQTAGGPPSPGEPSRQCRYTRERPYRPPVFPGSESFDFFPLAFSRRDDEGPARIDRYEIPRFETSGGLVLADTVATRLTSTDGRSIEAVETVGPGAPPRVRARTFVVAAGTFETARLLLASRMSRHENGLGNQSGVLGRGLTTHPNLRAEVTADPHQPLGIHRSYAPDADFRKRDLGGCLIQLHARSNSLAVNTQVSLDAQPENGLALLGDAAGAPAPAALELALSPRDLASLDAASALQETTLASMGIDPATTMRDRAWRYHPAGTCRMAASPQQGAVDRDGRVFGTTNLFVCGASVFPCAGVANPTLTIVALALRLTDHLLATRFPGRRARRRRF